MREPGGRAQSAHNVRFQRIVEDMVFVELTPFARPIGLMKTCGDCKATCWPVRMRATWFPAAVAFASFVGKRQGAESAAARE